MNSAQTVASDMKQYTDSPEPIIQSNFHALDMSLEVLDDRLGILIRRLDSILTPLDAKENCSDSTEPRRAQSNISERLTIAKAQVDRFIDRIDHTISILEI